MQEPAAFWTPLPHLGILRFAGPDAAAFLQGQVSNDTRRLAAGSALRAAYSTPQGRVVAVLQLLPHSSGILALLPRELVAPTQQRLRKYVLRAKVQIEDLAGRFAVLGRHGAMEPAAAACGEIDGIVTGPVVSDPSRCWAVGSLTDLARYVAATPTTAVPLPSLPSTSSSSGEDLGWRLADIQAGLPQVFGATTELFVAQMLNLDRVDGISFTKGCFTGQEIVARTQHLGRIKRRLHRLRLPRGDWTIGQAITLRDGRAGRLAELAPSGAGFEALAVLTLEAGAIDAERGPADAAAGPVLDAVELPLPYSLDA